LRTQNGILGDAKTILPPQSLVAAILWRQCSGHKEQRAVDQSLQSPFELELLLFKLTHTHCWPSIVCISATCQHIRPLRAEVLRGSRWVSAWERWENNQKRQPKDPGFAPRAESFYFPLAAIAFVAAGH
jgi:hypothetical protein